MKANVLNNFGIQARFNESLSLVQNLAHTVNSNDVILTGCLVFACWWHTRGRRIFCSCNRGCCGLLFMSTTRQETLWKITTSIVLASCLLLSGFAQFFATLYGYAFEEYFKQFTDIILEIAATVGVVGTIASLA